MNQREFPEPLEALLLLLITFGTVLVGGFLIIILIMDPQSVAGASKAVLIIGAIPMLLIPVIYSKLRGYNLTELFRLRPVSWEVVLYSFLIGITIPVVGDEIDRIVQIFITIPPEFLKNLTAGLHAESAWDWILLILGAVLIAAASEELMFRGFFQVTLEKKGDITRAVLIASFTWAITHLNIYWMIQIFIMGVIIGFLAWRTGSIIPAILVHAINNMLSLLTINFEDKFDWFEMSGHVSPFVLIPSVLILVLSLRHISFMYKSQLPD